MFRWFSQPLKLSPVTRIRFAWSILLGSLVGWPATHVLMLVTDPVENNWVFHVLLAISWFAISATAYDVLCTTDVRVTQKDSSGSQPSDTPEGLTG